MKAPVQAGPESTKPTTKADALRHLVRQRQSDRWPGYNTIADYHDGVYECDYVSPYTRSAGNLHAEVFILLQDWVSHDFLVGPVDEDLIRYGRKPSLPTNRNLDRLLDTHLGLKIGQTYATNLFPFIKPGGLTATIPVKDLVLAAEKYALPQIDIVRPRAVIALGLDVYHALARALGQRPASKLDLAIQTPMPHGRAQIWCQAHTGGLGQANRSRGGVDRVHADWAQLAHVVCGTRT
ncbi:MAG: hypothetical protein RLO46_13140 [Pseudomonadales bacterium]